MANAIQPDQKSPLTVGVLDLNVDPTIAQLRTHIEKKDGTVHRLALKTAAQPAPAFSNLLSELIIGAIDIMMFRTAAGVAHFMENLRHHDRQRALNCLADIQIIAASPNASAELLSNGLTPHVTVDTDASWRNVLTIIDANYRATNPQAAP